MSDTNEQNACERRERIIQLLIGAGLMYDKKAHELIDEAQALEDYILNG